MKVKDSESSYSVPVFGGFMLVQKATVDAPKLSTPSAAAAFFRSRIGDSAVEIFLVAGIDSKGRVLGVAEIARGGFAQCTVDPRVTFSALLAMGAVATFVVSHNHPSGDPEPSASDLALTRQLKAAGQLLCMRLVDHVIVTQGEDFSSMATTGAL